MLGHVRLQKHSRDLRVETCREEQLSSGERAHREVGRVTLHGKCVQVNDAMKAVGALVVDPEPDRTQVVSEGDVAGWLDTGQDAGHSPPIVGDRPTATCSFLNQIAACPGGRYAPPILSAVTYAVSTPVYEGPFDLLLHLIAKEQVNLFEVSISRIVDAFLVEIEAIQALDLDVATEFLLIASTLIELKLRKLLPERASVEMEEELALLEERDLLLAKLLEYQTFRHAAESMRRMETVARRSFRRTNVLEERFSNLSPDPLANVTAIQLRTAFVRAVTRAMIPKVEPKVSVSHITDVHLTVGDAVADLARELPSRGRATFRSLLEFDCEPMEMIVRFLATLELYKQGWVELDQPMSFGDLMITWCPDGPEVDLRFLPTDQTISIDYSAASDESTIDDIEDFDVEAELDVALAEAQRQRRFEAAVVESGQTGISVGGTTIVVDDYEG